mgnify:CR=1 FL=1
MEVVHATHKEHTFGWLSAAIGMAARIQRRTGAETRGLVVTPWSGRSPAGWSA